MDSIYKITKDIVGKIFEKFCDAGNSSVADTSKIIATSRKI